MLFSSSLLKAQLSNVKNIFVFFFFRIASAVTTLDVCLAWVGRWKILPKFRNRELSDVCSNLKAVNSFYLILNA